MRRTLRASPLALVLLLLSSFASAGPATDTVQTQTAELRSLVGTNDGKKLAALFAGFFDEGSMAEACLGSEWAARTHAEKGEFVPLVRQLVRMGHERQLLKLQGFTPSWVGEKPVAGQMRVETKWIGPQKDPIEIVFVTRQDDKGKWRVIDVVTDGVSLVASYRSQFTKIVKKDGFPTLITKMKDKIAKGDV